MGASLHLDHSRATDMRDANLCGPGPLRLTGDAERMTITVDPARGGAVALEMDGEEAERLARAILKMRGAVLLGRPS